MLNHLIRKNEQKSYRLKVKSNNNEYVRWDEIDTQEKLDEEIEKLFGDMGPMDYEMTETHNFTLILPQQYWGPGSYDKWIRVGWALKNTDTKLFLTWLKLSSQSSEFSFDQVSELYRMWYEFQSNNVDGLTKRSIMYWAKNDSLQLYKKVREEND